MKLFALLLVSLSFSVPGLMHAQEHRSVDAHVHGIAELTVLQDGGRVLLEFLSPAANIVGFEHAPQDDAQAAQLGEALQLLESADSVLMLSDLDCELVSSQASVSGMFATDAAVESAEHDHAHDAHEHDHETTVHDHHDSESGHAGFEVAFELNCRSEATLSEVTVAAFDNFGGLETIQIQWVLNRSQGAQSIGRNSRKVVELAQ